MRINVYLRVIPEETLSNLTRVYRHQHSKWIQPNLQIEEQLDQIVL